MILGSQISSSERILFYLGHLGYFLHDAVINLSVSLRLQLTHDDRENFGELWLFRGNLRLAVFELRSFTQARLVCWDHVFGALDVLHVVLLHEFDQLSLQLLYLFPSFGDLCLPGCLHAASAPLPFDTFVARCSNLFVLFCLFLLWFFANFKHLRSSLFVSLLMSAQCSWSSLSRGLVNWWGL